MVTLEVQMSSPLDAYRHRWEEALADVVARIESLTAIQARLSHFRGWRWPGEVAGLAWLSPWREHRRLLPLKGAAADAPPEPTALARRPAGRVSSLLHRADLRGVPSAGV